MSFAERKEDSFYGSGECKGEKTRFEREKDASDRTQDLGPALAFDQLGERGRFILFLK